MNDLNLKKCPFCGGKAEFAETSVYWVRCSNEQCEAETTNGENGTKEEAAEIWNRRTE
jgi:hypothetical protein